MTPAKAAKARLDASTTLVRAWKRWTAGQPSRPTVAPGALPQYAGLTSAQELAARQRQADADAEESSRRSGLGGLTIRTALQDLREVVVGVPADLLEDREVPLADLLARNDRLRGLGLLLLLAAVLSVAIL